MGRVKRGGVRIGFREVVWTGFRAVVCGLASESWCGLASASGCVASDVWLLPLGVVHLVRRGGVCSSLFTLPSFLVL